MPSCPDDFTVCLAVVFGGRFYAPARDLNWNVGPVHLAHPYPARLHGLAFTSVGVSLGESPANVAFLLRDSAPWKRTRDGFMDAPTNLWPTR